MASGLVSAFGGSDNSGSEPERRPITEYKVGVADDAKGAPTLRILAKRADGSGSKFQNLILWLDSPDAARALRAALPTIAKALDAIDAQQVKLGSWPAAKTAAPAAPAPAAPAAEPPAPPKSKLSSAFDDLPW
jgi:hypothetical protein